MITINDFFTQLNYLRENRSDYPTDIDPRIIDRLIGVNKNAYLFFEETIDIPAFDKNKYKDMGNLRKFLIDWHSTHSSIIKEQLQLSDAYSMSESDLNELFYCFGFDIGESIRKLPYQNKLQFIYNLIDLYKIKGTPDALFNVLRFFNVPAVDVCEYWLEKNQYGRLVFKERIIKTANIKKSVFDRKVPFESVVMSDPHWLYRNEDNLLQLVDDHKIALPSKTPYYSIRPTIPIDAVMTPVTAFLQRLAYDHYYNPEEDVQNISLSNGIQCSYLELYCACVYAFQLYGVYHEFKTSSSTGNYLIYNAPLMPIVFSEAVEPDYDLIVLNTRKYTLTELEFNRGLFIERFSKISSDTIFPNENSAEEILNERNSELRDYIYAALTNDVIDECLNSLFMDLSTWIRDNVDDRSGIAQAWTSLILDFDVTFLKYLKEAINFFKPLRARPIANEKLLVFDNPLEDENIAEDHGIVASGIIDSVYDFHTADSYPGILGNDSTSPDVYYSRNTFDTTSYFDIGASWDVMVYDSTSPFNTIVEHINDYYNKHTNVESDYIQFGWSDLDPDGFPLTSWSQGGFAKYDTGWVYDSPFNSDIVQVELVVHEYVEVSDPAEGEIDVPLDKVLVVTFNYDIDETTVPGNVTVTLIGARGDPIDCTIEVVGAVISITPTSNLISSTEYSINFLSGLKSVQGYPLSRDYGISFITTTENPFVVTAVDPLDDAIDIPLDSSIEITFNKEYDKSTAIGDNIYVEYEIESLEVSSTSPTTGQIGVPLDSTIVITFSENIDETTVSSSTFVTTGISGVYETVDNVVTFTPTDLLEYETSYSVEITTDLKSLIGQPLETTYSFSFDTELQQKMTVTSNGQIYNGAEGVPIHIGDPPIAPVPADFIFSPPVFGDSLDVTTLAGNVIWTDWDMNAVDFTIDPAVSPEIFIWPTSYADYNTKYVITLKKEIKSVAGYPLMQDYKFFYSTEPSHDYPGPYTYMNFLPEESFPQNYAVDIPVDSSFTMVFDRSLEAFTIDPSNITLRYDNWVSGEIVPCTLSIDLPDNPTHLKITPIENLRQGASCFLLLQRGICSVEGYFSNYIDPISFTIESGLIPIPT